MQAQASKLGAGIFGSRLIFYRRPPQKTRPNRHAGWIWKIWHFEFSAAIKTLRFIRLIIVCVWMFVLAAKRLKHAMKALRNSAENVWPSSWLEDSGTKTARWRWRHCVATVASINWSYTKVFRVAAQLTWSPCLTCRNPLRWQVPKDTQVP